MDLSPEMLAQMSPQQRQLLSAALLRSQGSPELKGANDEAHKFDMLAAVAQMANNPAAAAAAGMAQKNQQSQYKPAQMGQQGFSLPQSGQFIESPMYTDEKNAERDARQQMAAQAAAERAQQKEADRALRQSLQAQALSQQRDLAEQRMALAQSLKAMGIDAAAARAEAKDAKTPAKPAGKVLPGSEIRKLTESEGIAAGFNDLSAGFKPEFAGSGSDVIAGLQNVLGKKQPLGMGSGYADQSNWWQNYNEQKNVIRHKLFGSALTAPEKAAFDAASITEGMDPKEISRRLQQQQLQAAKAYNKLKNSYGKAGYNVGEFEDLTEGDAPKPGAPAATSGPKRLKFNPATGALE